MTGATWTTWYAIGLGSAVGGVLRHAVTEGIERLAGGTFPGGTIAVNVIGSLAIGACVALSASAPGGWSPLARHTAMTGLLGGFTTFSAFSAQTVALLQQGHWLAAAANVTASVGLGYWRVAPAMRRRLPPFGIAGTLRYPATRYEGGRDNSNSRC